MSVRQGTHSETSAQLEDTMADKRLTRDGVKNSLAGKAKQAKGRVKDAVGGLTGDGRLQVEGKIDQAEGKIQNAIGKVERKLDRKG
jgi:uncharacterized protein YjbJ (UPF0337 family)